MSLISWFDEIGEGCTSNGHLARICDRCKYDLYLSLPKHVRAIANLMKWLIRVKRLHCKLG